jgi:hypothetical protein
MDDEESDKFIELMRDVREKCRAKLMEAIESEVLKEKMGLPNKLGTLEMLTKVEFLKLLKDEDN